MGKVYDDLEFNFAFLLTQGWGGGGGVVGGNSIWRGERRMGSREMRHVCPGRSKVVASLVIIPYLGI